MPLTRNQIYRRRRIAVFSSIGVVLGSLVYLPMTLLAPLTPATAVVQPYSVAPSVAAEVSVPSYGASLIAADGYGTLARGGSEAAVPMASITKVITSLVVLEKKPLKPGESGPSVTTTAEDVAVYDDYLTVNGSVKPVRAGLSFTEYELLQLVLIESANNYTETLVNWAFGSQEAYLPVAREWLSTHGFTGITVADSTGISLENTATATDLVALAQLALQHPVIAEIVATPGLRMHDIGMLENSNPVLGEAGVTGLKTGTLRVFGYNLLFTASHQVGDTQISLYGVVMGAPNDARLEQDVLALLQSATAGFQEVSLVTAGSVLAEYGTAWGDTARLVADESESVVVWGGTAISVLVSGDPVTTGEAGEEAGTATFVVGDRTIELPLVLDSDVADPGFWWRLANPVALL
ncbi:D-alanyl-D-alanine carboxypeptidase family protein [Salinibacterium sp. ZJ450]|uniref:D-alanyl-D-alanine carboxypeptidase family protein n=1 Tax=Salinibacterium sp. ZJ450 TaxID=2708338 RepID=UPI001420CCFD|nr:D-alanyl-D-alanine carboxypeptidase [Salinibacterium sp. ZJ450]